MWAAHPFHHPARPAYQTHSCRHSASPSRPLHLCPSFISLLALFSLLRAFFQVGDRRATPGIDLDHLSCHLPLFLLTGAGFQGLFLLPSHSVSITVKNGFGAYNKKRRPTAYGGELSEILGVCGEAAAGSWEGGPQQVRPHTCPPGVCVIMVCTGDWGLSVLLLLVTLLYLHFFLLLLLFLLSLLLLPLFL